MATILGSIDIKDSERAFESVDGQRLIWSETVELFTRLNEEFDSATELFVQGTTKAFKERYELPGGGFAEKLPFQEAKPVETRRTGSFDVAYPIWVTGGALSWNRVAMAYLTMGAYRAHVQTIVNQFNNTNFTRILAAIFNNVVTTFPDPVHGDITVQTLANGDAVVYPPKIGVSTGATENYYVGVAYLESGISNTNDPIKVIRDKIEPRYGYSQGGSPIIVLCNTSAVPYLRLLADFDPVELFNVRSGDNITVPDLFPANRFLPRNARVEGTIGGSWVVSWPRMPSGWMIGVHADAPPPLMARTDEVEGLGNGEIQLLTEDEEFPFTTARWIQRKGYGVGNRLGAVAVALNGTSSYTIPTGLDKLEA